MAKRMQEQKGEKIIVAKSKSTATNLSSQCSDKFLIREKSECIQKFGDTHSYGETWKQDEKKFKIRRSVEFSSATARCIPSRVVGHSHGETCRYKRGVRGCGYFRIWNWEWRRCDRETGCFLKQLRWNPTHPVNQTAREAQKLSGQNGHTIYTCLQSQSTIRKQYSRSSGRSSDENMTTLWMIWTWIWLFEAYFWIPLFEQQFILDGECTTREEESLEQCGTVLPWNWKTDQWTKRNHRCEHYRSQRWYVDVDKFIVWKAYRITNAKTYVFSDSVWWKWEMILLRPGRAKLNGIRKTITSRIWIESTACRRSSSGKYSLEQRYWVESKKETKKDVNAIDWHLRIMLADSFALIGLSWSLA